LTLANERFTTSRYEKIAILTGLNYAAQGVGSIAIAPLVKRMPIRTVLFAAVLMFGVVSAMIMIIDSTTGGMPKFKTPDHQVLYGHWNPNLLFPIFTFSGLSYGMVELIRRVIPRDIVGGDPVRLKKMDGLVHVMYETAGTIGALTSERLIDHFGYNYSSFLSPVLFTLAAVAWWFLDIYSTNKDELMNESIEYDGKKASPTASVELIVIDRTHKSMTETLRAAFHGFYKAFYYGAWMCLAHRKFIWLIPGYTFALYGHRYLENGVVQIYAKSVLGNSGVAQVIVGGSNLGELLGALCVMIFTNAIPTPLPWLRLDGLSLQLVWLIPFFPFVFGQNARTTAWKLAPCMIPISFGWAGGDCSLGAYIQSTLSKLEDQDSEVSALGAVMAFLYVAYIILYSVISTLMGRWVDSQLGDLEGEALMQKGRYATKFVG
jgi:MFS family permease